MQTYRIYIVEEIEYDNWEHGCGVKLDGTFDPAIVAGCTQYATFTVLPGQSLGSALADCLDRYGYKLTEFEADDPPARGPQLITDVTLRETPVGWDRVEDAEEMRRLESEGIQCYNCRCMVAVSRLFPLTHAEFRQAGGNLEV